MGIAKWAAIAVTLLMGLANFGLVAQDNVGLKIFGPVLAAAAVVAAVGFATRRSWGVRAIIGVGAVNLATAAIGAVAGLDGWPIGLVLSGLALALVVVSKPATSTPVAS